MIDLNHVLQHTRELWDKARDKRIFLSGATGFFGAWLLESLVYCNQRLDLNVSATILTRDPMRLRGRLPHISSESCLQFVEGDIRTFQFPAGSYEYVMHAAAPTTSSQLLDGSELLSILIDGTRRVLTFAKSSGAKRLLLVSSGAVYGSQPQSIHHLHEDYRGGPDWMSPHAAYAEGKRVCEQLCAIAAQADDIRFAAARCFAFVGPHLPLDQHFAIGNFIADALANRRILIRGDGSPIRSYLYAADLTVWLWTLLLQMPAQYVNPEVVNVGSSEGISIRDLAAQVVGALNPKLEVEVSHTAQPNTPLLQYVPDVQRARDWYGLRQTITLREGIRRTAEWHRASPSRADSI
jgi:nucleoside-diphosphate-sugar epimerase